MFAIAGIASYVRPRRAATSSKRLSAAVGGVVGGVVGAADMAYNAISFIVLGVRMTRSTAKQILMEKSSRGAIARLSVEYARDVRGTSGGKWRECIATGVAVGVLNSTNLLTLGAFGRRRPTTGRADLV